MALSKKTQEILEVAMANRAAAKEISDAIAAAGGAPVAAAVAAPAAVPATFADLAEARTAVNALRTTVANVISSLKAAGLMAP